MNDKLLALIDGREKGAVPVSIGTSLALEGAFGEYPDRPVSPAPILKVKEVWFNVRTVIRNLIEAIPTDQREALTAEALWPALVEEMTIIDAAVVRGSTGLTRAVFYLNNYLHLQRKFPRAILRHAHTPKQVFMASMEDKLLRMLAKDPVSVDYRTFRTHEIDGQHPESFIVTHYPVDLLSRYSFKNLELLESHTGAIKPYSEWHTKLTNGNALENLPFCPLTLQLFGDKGNHFSSMPTKIRQQILDIADADHWSSVTTRDKIVLSMRRIAHPADKAILMAML